MKKYRFNRMETAGSLGDLGTLLPLIVGMVTINHVSPTGIFYSIGLFYILSGCYFGLPVPIQPMKVIAAYAISTGMTYSQISASTGLVCIFLLVIGATDTISFIGRLVPKSVVRGVQLSTGILLMTKGVLFVIDGAPGSQLPEPYLSIQNSGPVPITIIIGIAGTVLTFYFLNSKRYPAGIVVILFGLLTGLFLGTYDGMDRFAPGLYPPPILPAGLPAITDLTVALFVLVIPQLPMTIGNAIIANADLSREYFGEDSHRVTYRATTLSMAAANGLSFFLGGIPLCHGAGGLAAHYRFGARTAGSNLIIGTVFLALAVFTGPHVIFLIHFLPFSILGVLLLFAGSQLSLTILDMFARKDMFVVLTILSITLASSLTWGFLAGIILAFLLRSEKFNI
ncbi:putative sulfate/molybdate transporter [Desulfomarina sp.]